MQLPGESLGSRIWRTLLGRPIPTAKAHHERLSPIIGLPVFSSDSLSSVAYATEAILSILVLMSTAMLGVQIWVSLAIAFLISVVAASYRQTIHAYPKGGGSYIVVSENLGEKPGLVAGAALLMDYILTVAVSIAAGVAAIRSAYPDITPYATLLAILLIFLVGWINLRGVRESGVLFSIPTYGFIIVMLALVFGGIYAAHTRGAPAPVIDPDPIIGSEAHFPVWFIILRSFAAGCTALTGIEAVSDGVPAFRPPEAKNAAKVLTWMAILLAAMFLGIGYIVMHLPELSLHPVRNPDYKTVTAQVAEFVFGPGSPMFFVIQFFTAAILILAANTAYADFPRLCSFISRDGFLPRYLSRLGDRLVFHNGIIILAIAASALVYIFHGELDLLLPLYAVGVFTAFTLSQLGMVQHWRDNQVPGWKRSIAINGLGACLCAIVLGIIAYTKFLEGAWIVIVLLPMIVGVFLAIKRRYQSVARQLEFAGDKCDLAPGHITLLLVPRVNAGILQGLQYAQQLKGEVQAVHVTINEKLLPDLQRKWSQYGGEVPLVVLPSPFRSLIGPVVEYVDELRVQHPTAMVTVIVAEAVSTKWYQKLLTENVTLRLRNALQSRRNVVVATVRYFLE
jgi:amino acid transporter